MMEWRAHCARAGRPALVTGYVGRQVVADAREPSVVGSVATCGVPAAHRPGQEEIIAQAIQIGPYRFPSSRTMYCCTLFPVNPRRGHGGHIEAAEAALPIDALVDRASADAVVEDFEYPVIRSQVVRA